MKYNQVLAFCIKAFFWIFGLYIFGMIFVFSYFFPTFLRVIGDDTVRLMWIISYIVSSIGVLVLLYFYIYRHTFLGKKTDLIIRIFLLALFILPELKNSTSSLDFTQGLSMNILGPLSLVIISLLLLFPKKVISLFPKEKIKFTHRINGAKFLRLFILGACYSIILICGTIFVNLIIHPTFDKDYLLSYAAVFMYVLPALYPILYKKSWATPAAKIIFPLVLISMVIFYIYVEASLITFIPLLFIMPSLLYIYKDKLRSLLSSQKK